jgi:hypothetical protein
MVVQSGQGFIAAFTTICLPGEGLEGLGGVPMKKFCLLCIFFCITMWAASLWAGGKEAIGWLEMVRIYPGNLKIRAKMDTGAKSSSINVHNLKLFERNGETWAKFELREKTKKNRGETVVLEKKVIDSVKIKKKGGGLQERVTVKMEICISGIRKEIEMSLTDRSNFNYQVLIGREDLADDFIIDPSAAFTRKPQCKIPVDLNP